MQNDWLLTNRENGVVTITFNRPEARNAMTGELRAELCDILLELNEDPEVNALVLRGNGSFVAGGDLKGFAKTLDMTAAERKGNFVTRVNDATTFITTLATFTKPVIAVVEGDAAGAGISIALASDFVIAGKSSRFTFAHAHVGLALDLGLSYFLPRIVGTLEAKKLAMLGGQINAEEAKELGMISYLTEDDQVETELQTLLKKLGRMSVPALAAMKAQFGLSLTNDMASQLYVEAQSVGACAATEEFIQRVSAFVKK